jgi:hypothetical protein
MTSEESIISSIKDPRIKEAIITIAQIKLFEKDYLGIKRWDNLLKGFHTSGVVKLPVQVFNRVWRTPFYYFIEGLGNQEMMYIKPIKGEPYRQNDVFGFFGMSGFAKYQPEFPIILVEGPADWATIKQVYPFVLCTLTAGVSQRQIYFLNNITHSPVLTMFDNDEPGADAANKFAKETVRYGMKTQPICYSGKDPGDIWESARMHDWYKQEWTPVFMSSLFDKYRNYINGERS